MSNTVSMMRAGLPVAYVGSRDHEDQSPRALVDRALTESHVDAGPSFAEVGVLAVGVSLGAASLFARGLSNGARTGGATSGLALAFAAAVMASTRGEAPEAPAPYEGSSIGAYRAPGPAAILEDHFGA